MTGTHTAHHAYVRVTMREPSLLVHALLQENAFVVVRGQNRVDVRGMTAPQVAVTAALRQLDVVDLETICPTL